MLAYFLTLSSEAHSEAWTPVLLLLFTQMEKLEVGQHHLKVLYHLLVLYNLLKEERLRRFAASVYPLLCQLWCADLRPEVLLKNTKAPPGQWLELRQIQKDIKCCCLLGVQCAPLVVSTSWSCLWNIQPHEWSGSWRGWCHILKKCRLCVILYLQT